MVNIMDILRLVKGKYTDLFDVFLNEQGPREKNIHQTEMSGLRKVARAGPSIQCTSSCRLPFGIVNFNNFSFILFTLIIFVYF